MSKFYVVRYANTDPKDDRLKYVPRGPSTANAFDTFEQAQSAALSWAGENRREYVVLEVQEMGRAGPATPPAKWTPTP